MTRAALVLALVLLAAAARAATITLPVLELADDPRYRPAYAGIEDRSLGPAFPGAELGAADAQMLASVVGADVAVERETAADAAALADRARALAGEGAHYVLADLPADALLAVADAVAGLPVLVLNVSAEDDRLRGADCRANIVHVAPSTAMRTDALVEYLVAKRWSRILALEGPAAADADTVAALQRSAAKFGARVTAVKPFVLGKDPRRREENDVVLATGGADADVVFVADAAAAFAREVPYATMDPTPVVGAAGLMPLAWHWAWRRSGAPQVQHRFEALAMPRRMNGPAWAAWVAVRAVVQAAARAGTTDFAAVRDRLLDGLSIDGAKGNPLSVRAWDHQVRQPVLLATADAVIARAPLPEFLHRVDPLDTLGVDAPETACRL